MTKKLSLRALALTGAVAVLLAGCAAAPAPSAKPASHFCAQMVTNSGGLTDRSFNQSSWEGMQKAAKKLSIKVNALVSTSASDLSPNVEQAVASKCGLVLTVGYELAPDTQKQAKAHPKTDFAIVDETVTAPNVKPILFDTAQAAYLAGYLAAGASKTGKVATFGGGNQPPVTLFMDGFVDGVAKYNAVHKAHVTALGWNKTKQDGSFTGDFENLSKGKALAAAFIDQGADVILPVAGQVGQGAAAAAKDAGNVSIIWVDSDGFQTLPKEFQPIVLTSVLKNTGNAVAGIVAASKNGTFTNAPFVGTLKNGGVAIAPFHDRASLVSASLQKELERLKTDIVSGTIAVTSPSTPR